MPKPKTDNTRAEFVVKPLKLNPLIFDEVTLELIGTSPLIMHRYSEKARQELLLPSGYKNMAMRAATLKHDVPKEYRESMYRNRDPSEPALVHFPASAFCSAVAAVAPYVPGGIKRDVEKLVTMGSLQVNIFGLPYVGMDMVRPPGQAPDVRIRAYFREWCCRVVYKFARAFIEPEHVGALAEAAGMIIGLGDHRPEKGHGGQNGRWTIVTQSTRAEFDRIVKQQGRIAQQRHYDKLHFFDEDAAELYQWYCEELARRAKTKKTKTVDEVIPPAEAEVIEAVRKHKPNGKARRSL